MKHVQSTIEKKIYVCFSEDCSRPTSFLTGLIWKPPIPTRRDVARINSTCELRKIEKPYALVLRVVPKLQSVDVKGEANVGMSISIFIGIDVALYIGAKVFTWTRK
jgi:hypothetical protein